MTTIGRVKLLSFDGFPDLVTATGSVRLAMSWKREQYLLSFRNWRRQRTSTLVGDEGNTVHPSIRHRNSVSHDPIQHDGTCYRNIICDDLTDCPIMDTVPRKSRQEIADYHPSIDLTVWLTPVPITSTPITSHLISSYCAGVIWAANRAKKIKHVDCVKRNKLKADDPMN